MLAERADYELLIGTVDDAESERLDYMLVVASVVVATVAPGLLPWLEADEEETPPANAVLVTCQVAARLMADPSGAEGVVSMERIGWVQTAYSTSWSESSGLLPAGWRLLLKPWRPPDMASITLRVPHPSQFYVDADWLWPTGHGLVSAALIDVEGPA